MADSVGLNCGFNSTKGKRRGGAFVQIESVVGVGGASVLRQFSDNGISFESIGDARLPIEVGRNALQFTQLNRHKRGEAWFASDDFLYLSLAAISELFPEAARGELVAVVTLPYSLYEKLGEAVKTRLTGVHSFKRRHRAPQTFALKRVIVYPEGAAAVLSEILDEDGNICDAATSSRPLGVIDIGSLKSNAIWLEKLRDKAHRSQSFDIGCWHVVDVMRGLLERRFNRQLTDEYALDAALRDGVFYNKGECHDVRSERAAALDAIWAQLETQLDNVWPDRCADDLHKIFLTGGGVYYFGERLTEKYTQAAKTKLLIEGNACGAANFAAYAAKHGA